MKYVNILCLCLTIYRIVLTLLLMGRAFNPVSASLFEIVKSNFLALKRAIYRCSYSSQFFFNMDLLWQHMQLYFYRNIIFIFMQLWRHIFLSIMLVKYKQSRSSHINSNPNRKVQNSEANIPPCLHFLRQLLDNQTRLQDGLQTVVIEQELLMRYCAV